MHDAKQDLVWLLFILAIIGIVWYYTGGPSRPFATSSLFLNQPFEKRTEELKTSTENAVESSSLFPTPGGTESSYKYKIKISSDYNAKETDPKKEYIKIKASSENDKPLRVTGMVLEGKQGLDIAIGKGVYLPYSGQINNQEDIYLKPGEEAYITTGESPIGVSFRLNKCTGYFEQFQDFSPNLSKECPRPEDENLPLNLSDTCLDYLETIPKCEMKISIPYEFPPSCQIYISEKINYATCVEIHKNDPDFYKPEWRIYLGRTEELWKNKRETITLSDQNGAPIDWLSY